MDPVIVVHIGNVIMDSIKGQMGGQIQKVNNSDICIQIMLECRK